jgi:hypothetical protein
MTAGLRSLNCMAFGVPFRLAADSEVALTKILECAPFGTQRRTASCAAGLEYTLLRSPRSSGYRLVANAEIVAEGAELQPILDQLARDLMVQVANYAPDRVFLHAGVVGWQGRALVFPGASFAGKTTLVAELVRAGAAYYSDEYAVLDDQGRVHPYARDLQMRERGGLDQRPIAVAELNGRAGAGPLTVAHVVFTEFKESAKWIPDPMTAGAAVLEMLRHTIPVQRTPARVMATLAKMMEAATAFRSDRGEAREAAPELFAAISPCGKFL